MPYLQILLCFLTLLLLPWPGAPQTTDGHCPNFQQWLSGKDKESWVNPLKEKILQGKKVLYTTRFAHIPSYQGSGSKIVGITPFKTSLYVTTSVSGGVIYRVYPLGKAKPWFNVSAEVERSLGASVDYTDPPHGGVRGIAFHPKFKENGLFYVSYMERRVGSPNRYKYFSRFKFVIPADGVVAEFRANPKTMAVIPFSYRQVIRIGMKVYDHPIKQIIFHDDLLYISHGDGSIQSGTTGGGQGNDGLGKILRIDPMQYGGHPYRIPPSNPFYGNNTRVAWPNTAVEKKQTYKPEIYALGFRNPHNLCFSKKGELFVADAGRDNVEEINIIKAGDNCGWPLREGPFIQLNRGGVGSGVKELPNIDVKNGFRYPAAAYGHEGPYGCRFIGQAIAMSCPIENGSPLNGLLLYANFPTDGAVYYSYLSGLRKAITKGSPKLLTRAAVFKPKILYDPDGPGPRKAFQVSNLLEIIRYEKNSDLRVRVDMRFGIGSRGEIYWSSKSNGWIYLITTTLPRKS